MEVEKLDWDEAVQELERFMRETVNEDKIQEHATEVLDALVARYPHHKASLTKENRQRLKAARALTKELEAFTLLLEDMQDTSSMDEYDDTMKALTHLSETFDGFEVRKRIQKEIREFRGKFGHLARAAQRQEASAIERLAPKCKCNRPMTLRKGPNSQFWGCRSYPHGCNTRRRLTEEEAVRAAAM